MDSVNFYCQHCKKLLEYHEFDKMFDINAKIYLDKCDCNNGVDYKKAWQMLRRWLREDVNEYVWDANKQRTQAKMNDILKKCK